jgi:hypothetical protein
MYVIKTGVEEHKFLHMSSSTTEKKNKAILRHIHALASAAIIIAGLLSFTQSPVLATQTTTSNNNSDAAVQDTLEDARNSTALAQSRVNNIGVGVLAYTHGDMVNEYGTPEMEKMTSIEETLESRFRTPTEIVFHMPYNWDLGLEKLDEQRVEYAIFLYTDMFGPESTVIHNVTRGVFGGIEEYNYCPGVPLSDNGCQYMGQNTFPASQSSDTVLVFAEPARPDHPLLRNIFVKQAREVSDNPRNEILVLIGHGARSDTNDDAQVEELTRAAEYAERRMRFADSAAFTAREDWPELQPAAIEEAVNGIRSMLEETGTQNVVLVPATGSGSGFHMVTEALEEEGIPFTEAPDPLPLGEREFIRWSTLTVAETIAFIRSEQPTESTITPYWSRNY